MKGYEFAHDEVVSKKDEKRLIKESKRSFRDQLLEKVTPSISLLIIVLAIVLSIWAPNWAALYILGIFIFFLYKSSSSAILFALGLRRILGAEQIDWEKKLQTLENPKEIKKDLEKSIEKVEKTTFSDYQNKKKDIYEALRKESRLLASTSRLPLFFQEIIFKREKRKVLTFLKKEVKAIDELKGKKITPPSDLQQVVIIPHVKEPKALLRETLVKLANQTFNTKQINIVLAAEAADPNGISVSEELKEEFKSTFNNIWITSHQLQPYDIIGKSSNMNWAGRVAHKIITDKGWDLKKVLLTSCDADSKFQPHYFSMLSYYYLTTPNAEYKVYSGAMVFYNNIWRVPFYSRIQNSFYSIYNVGLTMRPDRYIPVSTYSLSFWMMEKIEFWAPYVVPEDFHIFFKCLYKFDKKVSAIPMPIKILSDSAEGETHWKTFMNSYNQFRRWSWGVSDHAWMLKNLFTGFAQRSVRAVYMTAHVIFDHNFWPPMALIVFFGGNLPIWFNPEFINEPAGALLPNMVSTIVNITIIFLLIMIFLNFYLRPIPAETPWWKKPFAVLEWAIFPITGLTLSLLPAIDAQSKLMFQNYLEHFVTIKRDSEGEVSETVKKEKGKNS